MPAEYDRLVGGAWPPCPYVHVKHNEIGILKPVDYILKNPGWY